MIILIRNCQYLIRPPGDPAAEEWSQWSVCSLTCGQGWQVRTRSCVSSPYGTLCSGALRETRMCNNTASCPGEHGITSSGTSAAPQYCLGSASIAFYDEFFCGELIPLGGYGENGMFSPVYAAYWSSIQVQLCVLLHFVCV